MALLVYSPTGILGILDRWLRDRRALAASALRGGVAAGLSDEAAS
jgi:branched-chain amino acid transport system permease protein